MIVAAYADVGAGLAFLLLLALSTVGLIALLFVVALRLVRLRASELCGLAVGLFQAWFVYVSARLSNVPRSALEWAWLISLGVVVATLAAGAVIILKRKPA